MDYFSYRQDELFIEENPVSAIIERFATPCYIYSLNTLKHNWQVFSKAALGRPHVICYAVKANANLAILQQLATWQAGFDIVSAGELTRVLAAGRSLQKIIFSGVGKTADEMVKALAYDVYSFNVESVEELKTLNQVASQYGKKAKVALRINPAIDAKTHPYITTGLRDNKFGIASEDVYAICELAKTLPNIIMNGIACHIGSQLTTLEPFIVAAKHLYQLAQHLRASGYNITHINMGGGLGVPYKAHGKAPTPEEYIKALYSSIPDKTFTLIFEPGRALIANAGILVTRILYLKQHGHKRFAIVDAAMNDLLRPALYQAWHEIVAVKKHTTMPIYNYDVVGPICESSDYLAQDRPLAIAANDLLAVHTTGAYGFSMSSNYNARPRSAEVLIDGTNMHLIREREAISELFAKERLIT